VFGRGSEYIADVEPDVEEIPSIEPRRPVGARLVNNRRGGAGPFDVDDPDGFDIEGGLDFGSLRVPMPARAQLQVEHGSGELLRAVHVLVPAGRVSLSALAAPRSSPLWRDLAEEIAGSLAKDGARVWAEWGSWGREVLAGSKGALSRFIGVDGPRWMLYGVATGPAEDAAELVDTLREMIRSTVVTRGPDPLPVKTVLPLRLPEHLEERVEQAREQSARLSGGEAGGDAVVPVGPTGLAEEPETAAGPFAVDPFGDPFPVGSAPGELPVAATAPAFPGPLAPVRPVAAPPAAEYGAAAQQPGVPGLGAPGPGSRRPGVPAGPARIGYPGQPAGPGRAPSVPSRPAAARTPAYPPGSTSAPARHPSSPPGSLHPSTPPGSLHRSIGARATGLPPVAAGPPAGSPAPAGYPGAGGQPSRTGPPMPPPAGSASGPFAGSFAGARTKSPTHPDRIPDSRGLDSRGLDSRGGAYGGAGGPVGAMGGDRRRGLPPVPTTSELDTNGFRRPGVESTWSLAKPVVSADQVAQQPAWALLSDAPAFWPHPTPPRGTRVPEPPDRGALDDATGHPGRSAHPMPPYPAGPPARPAGSAPSRPAEAYSAGPPGYPAGAPAHTAGPHRRPAASDPVGQHRSARYPGGQLPSGQYSPGQPPGGQLPSGQYPPGRPPARQYPPARHPADQYPPARHPADRRPVTPPLHQSGPPYPAGRPVGPPPTGADRAPWPGHQERDGRPERPGRPADGSAPPGGIADSLHLALTQDSAVTGDRAALIDRSGRHRRPQQPGQG